MSTQHRPGLALHYGRICGGRVARSSPFCAFFTSYELTDGCPGDVFFHLLGEIFLSGEVGEHVRFVMVNTNKNLLLGVAILVGFVTFVAMDKALRIATGGSGHDHGHDHGASNTPALEGAPGKGISTGASIDGADQGLRSRKQPGKEVSPPPTSKPDVSQSVKLSAYLNLIADFTHNITDGLALSASFYASPALGAITTTAVFFQ